MIKWKHNWRSVHSLSNYIIIVFSIITFCRRGNKCLIKWFWKVEGVCYLLLNKWFNDWPQGKQWLFSFPKTLGVSRGEAEGNIEVEGKQNSLFPAGPVIKSFVIPPNSKLGKTTKKLFALLRLAHKFAAVSTSTTWWIKWVLIHDTWRALVQWENVFGLRGITIRIALSRILASTLMRWSLSYLVVWLVPQDPCASLSCKIVWREVLLKQGYLLVHPVRPAVVFQFV